MRGKSNATRPLTIADHEAAIQQAWYDLIVAEDRGMDASTLERLFLQYLRLLEALVAARKVGARIQQSAA